MRSARDDLRYGITLNLYPTSAATSSAADQEAARRVDGICNRVFLDPILRSRYPEDVLADLEPIPAGAIADGDDKQIGQPLDLLGVNYYSLDVVRAGTGRPNEAWVGAERAEAVRTGLPVTAADWEIDPTGLYDILTRVAREYHAPPLYVTENGAAFPDVIADDGGVHDEQRVAFLAGHFRAAHRVIRDGVDLRVLRLVTHGQFRMGLGLRPPFRSCLCRLRQPATAGQGQRSLGCQCSGSKRPGLTSWP